MDEIQLDMNCEKLHSNGFYNYSMQLQDSSQIEECDLRWKAEDGTVLGLGNYLVREYCERGIRYIDECKKEVFIFNVFNSTSDDPFEDRKLFHLLWLIPIGLILFVLLKLFISGQRGGPGNVSHNENMNGGLGTKLPFCLEAKSGVSE
ncbi:uncharacterized protein LOC124381765 isoform X2 [Silurus meridionalis]|uniref:uncharacterized protein LOC124381765 isoform X2 n=1 Tax=Silurus meridionalis TaxID=175797 RepID=UPI001EEA9824|nr:uncharacterized protein LOC124381765 isoform X2 [Silurus meridionalis]